MDARIVQWIESKYRGLHDELSEFMRRRWAAVEAVSLGRGGISVVSAATGLAHSTIRRGIRELNGGSAPPGGRERRPGAGRKRIDRIDPYMMESLERLVEPESRGDPQSPLRWTCKSTRRLAKELTAQGHAVGPTTVRRLLKEAGYSLQANRKTREGKSHPDRDAQFRHINRRVETQQRQGQPAISVDTKKKETLGNLKNPGTEWRPKGRPREVDVHDFPDPRKGKAVPYGVYDLAHNEAWVSVGVSSDTAEFAVAAIRTWWKRLGRRRHPQAKRLLITADSGGSNSCRNRLWKVELQRLSNETGLEIEVCHFPPGTSKWNKIEHRLFCHVTRNWRGQPLETYEIVVNLIGSTTTDAGLIVHAQLDADKYQKGRKVSNEEFADVNLTPSRFHGEWNYVIRPND
ncbi:MAG: ISAzo13 family transposase [Gemmataceae bacterium]